MVSRIGLPLLFLLVLAVFGRTLGFDFINYDDPIYVYENEVVKQGLGGEGSEVGGRFGGRDQPMASGHMA